jgi:hypothetical protein
MSPGPPEVSATAKMRTPWSQKALAIDAPFSVGLHQTVLRPTVARQSEASGLLHLRFGSSTSFWLAIPFINFLCVLSNDPIIFSVNFFICFDAHQHGMISVGTNP